jgi:hypothetical protein
MRIKVHFIQRNKPLQNTKIVSFGDSFIFGSELPNNTSGQLSWPGIIASRLGCQYKTEAVPGCGNDHIARQIYSYFSQHDAKNTLAVINWTWTQRWDFFIAEKDCWITLGPTCVPDKLSSLVDQTQSHRLIDFYRDYAGKSLLWNKFRNLQTIYAVNSFLIEQGISNIQTYMDYHLFDQTWYAPDYVQALQEKIKPNMQLFEGKNFVDWSYQNKFTVTEFLHPLTDAHNAAADLWQHAYQNKLKEQANESVS